MTVNFIREDDREQLRDTGEEQVRVQGGFVLSFPVGDTKTVFEVINGAFHGSADFISIVPFWRSANGSRKSS